MTDLELRLAARARCTPEHGWNVVAVDDYEPAGEELTLVSHHDTRAEADTAAKKKTDANPGTVFYVYGHQDEAKP